MGCSRLLILGLVLNIAHWSEILGFNEESLLEIPRNVTGVLGEDVHLGCRYLGKDEITAAEWKRESESKISKRLTGFINGRPFNRDTDFSVPHSLTNLTVRMNVTNVKAEGVYKCKFMTEDEEIADTVFLSVVARPDIQIQVNAEIINGTHHQTVTCFADGGRPTPQISWLVNNRPPSNDVFNIDDEETIHPNGTSTLSSSLHFPTHLQDEDSVTCMVQHLTLPKPKLTTVRVDTYLRPNVSIKAEMVQQRGSEFWVVSCISSGGRPNTDISLALDTDEDLQTEDETGTDSQTISVHLPAATYKGHNITCMFDHPKFTHRESRVITLPSYYLSGVHLSYSGMENRDGSIQTTEYLELQEGQTDALFTVKVTGNVPSYNVTCEKDGGPVPEGVNLVGSSLSVQGPVNHVYAGLYECVFYYHHHRAMLHFNITVRTQPVPPSIQVDLQTDNGSSVIECSAADAVPAANMSWLLPEGVSGVAWFNFTSHNGSHSVRGVLLLPACSPWELTAKCVINHPAFEKPENRSITLPLCDPPNITLSSSTESRGGDEYTKVECSVESVAPAAAVTWQVGNSDSNNSTTHVMETEVHEVQADGLVLAQSSVHFLSSFYSDQNLTCVVEHPSLEAPEKRTMRIPGHRAPMLSASLKRQSGSELWMAECICSGDNVGTNLAWVLPENAKAQTSLDSRYEGHVQKATLTYHFPLALHEGQDLTCVYNSEHGFTNRKTVHVPRYYISMKVLNHTTPLQSRYGGEPVARRLTLQENQHNQRILLHIEGNVPEYSLYCQRSDGSFVQTEKAAMVFKAQLTEQDEGLYTCRAYFYHHTATVNIQVEVTSEDKQFVTAAVICISSASAIIVILAIALWVFCKITATRQYKKPESLSALTALMQDPGSPAVKKPAVMDKDSKEYAQLVNYSIVIDVKSTV
ncbi:hemicentin-1 isoform X2 [Sphaeramia orbicularis]|uniref:hemicentin-1 isoform X2 n=1 Tax=Sphaeramia orbicularis TaxID=375764 RepID=UPI00117C6C84|nr:hemicentin-1-like isoform X2 [Sphaeramia orbicularis]